MKIILHARSISDITRILLVAYAHKYCWEHKSENNTIPDYVIKDFENYGYLYIILYPQFKSITYNPILSTLQKKEIVNLDTFFKKY